MKRADVDLVVITSPNTTHFPYVKEAILNGKHVVVENHLLSQLKKGKAYFISRAA